MKNGKDIKNYVKFILKLLNKLSAITTNKKGID